MNGKPTGPDGAITPDDRTIIGDPNPKFTAGWQNQFTLGRLPPEHADGRDVRQQDSEPQRRPSRSRAARARTSFPTATSTHGRRANTGGRFPRINFTPGTTGSDITSDLLEDGSFLRLRSVTLDVQVPERLLSRIRPVEHARVRHGNEPDHVDALQRVQPGREQPRARQRQPRRRRRRSIRWRRASRSASTSPTERRTQTNAQSNEDRRRARPLAVVLACNDKQFLTERPFDFIGPTNFYRNAGDALAAINGVYADFINSTGDNYYGRNFVMLVEHPTEMWTSRLSAHERTQPAGRLRDSLQPRLRAVGVAVGVRRDQPRQLGARQRAEDRHGHGAPLANHRRSEVPARDALLQPRSHVRRRADQDPRDAGPRQPGDSAQHGAGGLRAGRAGS